MSAEIVTETLLDIAQRNLRVAHTIFQVDYPSDDAFLNFVGYHLQQSIELALKHVLETHGIKYPKTHDIDDLIALLPDECQSLVNEISDNTAMITKLESVTRYTKGYRTKLQAVNTVYQQAEHLITKIQQREQREQEVVKTQKQQAEKQFNKDNSIQP